MAIGADLREARSALGETQHQAALRIGCQKESVSEWEAGKRSPKGANLVNVLAYIQHAAEKGAAR